MNKSKIEWTDYTWNPVTGCKHGCSYCYARKIATRFKGTKAFPYGFEPRFIPERLGEPTKVKTPSKIFVCSMADLFGAWVPREWIRAVLVVVRRCPQHTFQFLTKNPERLKEFNPWPPNCWVGATTATAEDYRRATIGLPLVKAPVRFISMEPLLFKPPSSWIDFGVDLDWIIIGAQTGPGAVKVDADSVEYITDIAHNVERIPVFHKDNLGDLAQYKEFPVLDEPKRPATRPIRRRKKNNET